MSLFSSLIIAPVYRLLYGPPLSGLNPAPGTARGDGGPQDRPLAIVADGVGGFDVCGTGLRYVMAAEGLPHAIEVCPWGHGFGRWLADLTDVGNRDAKARSIAEMIKRFKTAQPDQPVFVVAKSGGSGVVVKALELLDQDAVERVILLAPALSPSYDLTRALGAVRGEMVVFWSPLDVFILGLGTRVFGTIDRVRTAGAGLVGFEAPAGNDLAGAELCLFQSPSDPLAASDDHHRLPWRSFRTRFSVVPQGIRPAAFTASCRFCGPQFGTMIESRLRVKPPLRHADILMAQSTLAFAAAA